MNITDTPVAVLHHRTFADRHRSEAEILVAHAVDSGSVTTVWHRLDDSGPRGRIIDAFLDLWSQHRDTGLILYVSDPVVRNLLKEQVGVFPGLVVRDVVSGARLAETWRRCRDAFECERITREPVPVRRCSPTDAAPLVIATDASRGTRGKETGLGIVTSAVNVTMSATRTKTVLAGEFAAVDLALQKWWQRTWTMDILTDSQLVWRRLNREDLLATPGRSPEETRCVHRLHDLRRKGVTVRVHWIRSHNGHVLNEFADRAAVAARRSSQWELDTDNGIAARLQTELREALADHSGELVPSGRTGHHLPAAV